MGEMYRLMPYLRISIVFGVLLFATFASAAELGPGCRAATPRDQTEMADRGLPRSFEVCPKDALILGIGKNFEQWYTQIKAMPQCSKNTCTLSCRTRNTGAQVCGPTAARWNSIGCHPNNNTAIFPAVSYGFAAHIELLRRYCGERGRCTIGSAIQQWAPAGHADNQPAAYAAFVSRAAGIPANQVYDPNDIDLMGRLAMAMACFEAGSLPYSADELKQGLVMAAGGARVPVPANVGELLNESLTGSYAANPAGSPNSHPGSWAYPQPSINGNGYRPPTPPAIPLPVIKPSGVNPTNPGGSNPGANPETPNTNSGLSAALIIAQPARVKRGNPVLVSWSSVGMNAQAPCQVSENGQLLAQANAGSKIIQTKSIQTGTLSFTLSCTTQAGAQMQQSISVSVN